MTKSAFIEIEGHIFDSHLFEKILETIRSHAAEYRVLEVLTGSRVEETSRARMEINAASEEILASVVAAVTAHGARVIDDENVDPAHLAERSEPAEAEQLGWGRRFLMCPPDAFGVLYEINPWMHKEVTVDRDKAREQWNVLRETIIAAGAEVEELEPVEGLPDFVFTANAGLVDGKTFIPSSFRHPERQGEAPHATAWFRAQGFTIAPLSAGLIHEGAGDALPFNNVLVSGYRTRSDAPSHAEIARIARAQVRAVELADPRLYHLDLTFCPLDSRRALVTPTAWDEHGQRVMRTLVPEPLVLDHDEALAFCANSVVIGKTIIMPACPARIEQQLRAWGFEVVVVDVSEFMKAGGACRCLTLALDVTLGKRDNR